MSQLITCPLCQFSKEVPADKLPSKQTVVTCPKCGQKFTFNPQVQPASPTNTLPPSQSTTQTIVSLPQSEPSPVGIRRAVTDGKTRKSWASLDLKTLTSQQKTAVAVFILVVLFLVGVRIWADGKARDIPFPNMIASKADQIAISWGQQILVFDQSGKSVSNIDMPRDTKLTHITYDTEGNLWLGDFGTKQIFRRQGTEWQVVINGAGTIGGTFKFVQVPPTGEIFVTDSTNHRILAYSATGQLQRTFGKSGKGQGELMFPNEILLYEGDLLVVNTNAGRLDLFSREGTFLKTYMPTETMGNYRFPTLMTWLDSGWYAYLLTVDLYKAKAVAYDRDGNSVGEFVPPHPLREAGDIAFFNGKAIITDIGKRQVYTFDATNFEYLGPFNKELADRANYLNRIESGYKTIGQSMLLLLLVISICVGIVMYRSQRNNSPAVAAELPTPEKLWGVPTDKRQFVPMGISLAIILALKFSNNLLKVSNPSMVAGLIAVMLIALVVFLRSMMASGLANIAHQQRLQQLLLRVWPKVLPALSDEEIIGCTTVRHSRWLRKITLLVLTDKRLIFARCGLEAFREPVSELISFPYGQVVGMRLAHTRLSSGWASRMLKSEEFELTVTTAVDKEPMILIGNNRDILEKVQSIITDRQKTAVVLPIAEAERLPIKTPSVSDSWKPALLSALYPGLGQFCNCQIFKGSALAVIFTAELLALTGPTIKLINRSAELWPQDIPILTFIFVSLLTTWMLAVIDAWRTASRKVSLDG